MRYGIAILYIVKKIALFLNYEKTQIAPFHQEFLLLVSTLECKLFVVQSVSGFAEHSLI